MIRRLRDVLGGSNAGQNEARSVVARPESESIGRTLTGQQMAAVSLVLTIGKALHMYGSPAHRLEVALGQLSRTLGLHGQFFSTPTSLFIAFGEDEHQRTYLIRVEPGEVNLEKLCLLDEVLERVTAGEIAPIAATELVKRIIARSPRYSRWLMILCHTIAPAGATVFFGGSWREMVLAATSGFLIGMLAMLLGRRGDMARLFDVAAGFTAAAVAVIGASLIGPLSIHTATVAGVIVLVPGLTLTVAMNELATRHLASGTARFMGALVVLMSLAFGVAIGFELRRWFVAPVMFDLPSPAGAWLEIPVVIITASALTIMFQSRLWDLPLIVMASLLAYFGSKVGSQELGPFLGVFLGAFGVSAFSNLLAKIRNRPAAVTLLPGLILLVPGSLGFRSLASLLEHNVVSGVEAAFTMLMVAVSIVAGIFFGSVVVPTRKAL